VVGEIFRLSVRIRDISIEGKMQVFLRFINEYPYLDIIQVAFKSNPKVDFSLQVMKTIELMDISFMNEWLSTSITSALSQYLVLPRNVRISLKEWWVPGSAAPTRVDAQVRCSLDFHSFWFTGFCSTG
jgi:Ca2+-dependent lipid-binding protein